MSIDMIPNGPSCNLIQIANPEPMRKSIFENYIFFNLYLSIDECHPETFDFHFRDGHQVLLVIRYIKEIL